jgi:hypothetical protein
MKLMKNGIKMTVLLVLLMIGVIYALKQEVLAAAVPGPIKICAVSYADNSILVINNTNTKIYYATDIDAARNKWDVIPASGKITAIDISWLKKGSENIMKIKGDKESETRIVLLEEPDKLEVSINYSDLESLGANATIGQLLNIRASVGDGINPITMNDLEWKKGESSHWLKTNYLTKGLLENYMAKGVYLYFRIAPVDDVVSGNNVGSENLVKFLQASASNFAYTKPDFIFTDNTSKTYKIYSDNDVLAAVTATATPVYPDGTNGRRASEEVKLKISELKASPTTDIDGSEFKVELKYGQEYRITTNGGATPNVWRQVTDRSVRTIKLSDMLNNVFDGSATKPFPDMTIEVRNFATSKTASSKITKIILDKDQRVMQDSEVKITYNGVKNVIMTIPNASTSKPYEYCVVKDPTGFDVENARWTKVTKNTGVNILATKAPDGSTIIVRMTELKYNAKNNTSLELASTYEDYKLTYPAIPTAEPQVYTFTKGYSKDLIINVTLNEDGKVAFETGLKYIKLGTVAIPVKDPVVISPPFTTDPADPNFLKKHVMTITIEEATLKSMINCTKKQLSIYYNNGTVDKTSSKLTIKNPSKAPTLTVSFKAGSSSGTAFQIAVPKANAANTWHYTTTAAEIKDVYNEDKFTDVMTKAGVTTPVLLNIDSADNIVVTPTYWVSVFEVDASGYIVRYVSKQIN